MRYVLIGNSAAAIGAAEGIRSIDKTGEITIISNEPHHTYSRPLISYLLQGKTDEQRMKYRKDSFYSDNRINTLLGMSAVSIDPQKQLVTLDDETQLEYDRLLIATGSSPFIPQLEGLDTVRQYYTFMSLNDAKAIDAALKPDHSVLIIGAGLIGLKCAEGIKHRCGDITVVDIAPKILSSILDDDGAAIVKAHLEDRGIRFKLNDSVLRFKGDTAVFKSGDIQSFDMLIIAVGVRPNVELFKAAGGLVDKGILVNERMETSILNIYAAGDCTQSHDISCGKDRILALLPAAYMQGETAGINMAGGAAAYNKAIPMNAIGLLGLHMITAGSYIGENYCDTEGGYRKLFYADDLLKGYIMIGNVEKTGIYTSLIREQTRLGDIDFPLICKRPGLMAFSSADRIKKLGGVSR